MATMSNRYVLGIADRNIARWHGLKVPPACSDIFSEANADAAKNAPNTPGCLPKRKDAGGQFGAKYACFSGVFKPSANAGKWPNGAG